MRAFVITGPGQAGVQDVPAPIAGPGAVVVEVARVGVCGTDQEFYSGDMVYLASGDEHYPVRIGHEWCGVVSAVGDGVDASWLGRRVTGDTMLGCQQCERCRTGRQHVCAERSEIGVRGGYAGALAEQLAVPVSALHALPDTVDDAAGALVEPGGNSLRAVWAAGVGPGGRLLVTGAGTIGLLCALFARADGAEVHLLGRSARSLEFARSLGFEHVWTGDSLPNLAWDAVIEASNSADLPARALDLVEPGGRVVYIGIASVPTPIDTRDLLLKDVTAAGILSASPGLAATIERYASGAVDPRPLVAATLSLDEVVDFFAHGRPAGTGPGPKIQVQVAR